MKEEIDRQLEDEVTRLSKVERIQEEIQTLNKSLNACIDIVSSSIGNDHTEEQLRRLKEENEMGFSRVNNEMDETIERSRDNIQGLREEKKALIEKEKEENKVEGSGE